jgi:hypothetical protein
MVRVKEEALKKYHQNKKKIVPTRSLKSLGVFITSDNQSIEETLIEESGETEEASM